MSEIQSPTQTPVETIPIRSTSMYVNIVKEELPGMSPLVHIFISNEYQPVTVGNRTVSFSDAFKEVEKGFAQQFLSIMRTGANIPLSDLEQANAPTPATGEVLGHMAYRPKIDIDKAVANIKLGIKYARETVLQPQVTELLAAAASDLRTTLGQRSTSSTPPR